MTPELILILIALFVAVLAFLARQCWSNVDDEAAGVLLGPETLSLGAARGAGHAPELTRVVCSVCRRVRCADKQWRPEREVRRPEDFGFTVQTSHGYCPRCADAAHSELESLIEKPLAAHMADGWKPQTI